MGYRKAEICLDGHTTTNDFKYSGELASPYCPKCGMSKALIDVVATNRFLTRWAFANSLRSI